ncbi:MAG: class I SAM-dependent methyltransferase [Desulfobacterales bacterium]|nr:class I SAM-dependent methyltransferase [Desulfobacterales bacterium]
MKRNTSIKLLSGTEIMTDKFCIRFPASTAGCKSQDEEYCIVDLDGQERRIRFHDYGEIYDIPGLYEYLFYEKLKCTSPEVVAGLLVGAIGKSSVRISELDVLDVGAGNGIVGELLRQHGINSIVGIDIIAEAAEATRRDRPAVYDEYHVEDLQNLSSDARSNLEAKGFNCLISVGALGYGDIPAGAFANAYNLITDGGWIAFNINAGFLEKGDSTGFAQLIGRMVDSGVLKVIAEHQYCHRLSVNGRPLSYMAVIGIKERSVPEDFLS